ncbi:acyl-CoA N-acyltransferase [Scleroderma citrinum]
MEDKPYDVNFCFPVRDLENGRVKLTPLVPSIHADLLFQGCADHPELFQYLPFGPYGSASDFTEGLIEGRIHPSPSMVLYAIIDKTRCPDTTLTSLPHAPSRVNFAGMIGYLNTCPINLKTEIGFIMVFPPFQRTHVATNAVGLLLQYALDPPSSSDNVRSHGLGLRRVQWQTNELNTQSIRTAERMGFKFEGILRWDRVLPSGKGKLGNGVQLRADDPKPGMVGRHTVILSICWDDWENGGREEALRIMARQY